MQFPSVDIVIATIGRRSLEQAVLSAMHQTYHRARTVVIGDGPCADAEEIFNALAGDKKNMIYRETPERLGMYGDGVKRWWIDNEEAGDYIRFLDDDDWLPPNAIADMMRLWEPGTAVILCSMVVVLPAANHARKGEGYWHIAKPALQAHHAASGMALIRTDAARQTDFPFGLIADSSMAIDAAQYGAVKITDTPLYWYNAHQGGKTSSIQAGIAMPYTAQWPYKPPRTFRKSLFARVPLDNYLRDGRALAVYDQALFRPMGRMARKSAWITSPCYFYDMPDPDKKTVSLSVIKDDAAWLISRGYVPSGRMPRRVEPRPGPLVCFIMPAYRAADTIGRAIESVAAQRGDWECIVSVDADDMETEAAAHAAIGDDARFRIIRQRARLYALGNILFALNRVPDNRVVAFVDADDYLLVDDLVWRLERLYADPDVEIVCGSNAAFKIGRPVKKTAPVIEPKRVQVRVNHEKHGRLQAKLERLHARLYETTDMAARRHIAESIKRVLKAMK